MKVGEWDSELMGRVLHMLAVDPITGKPRSLTDNSDDPRLRDLIAFFKASRPLQFFTELLGMMMIGSPSADTFLGFLRSNNVTMFYAGYRYHEHEILEAIKNSGKEPHKQP